MSGKQSKKERKAKRDAERRAAAKAERQRTLATVVIIAIVVAIGGVLVYFSIDREEDLAADDVADEFEDLEEQFEEFMEEQEDAEDGDDADGEDVAAEDDVEPCDPDPAPEGAGEDKPTYDEPDEVLEDGVDYEAVIETSCGQVVVELDAERAPETVNSFVFLAEDGFFDNLLIFRNATTIGALQTGAGDNDNTWQVGYQLDDELERAEEEGYPPGTVAMANAGPDTAGSQFFFVYNDLFQLDPDYTAFGEVTEGLDVLQSIGAIETEGPQQEDPVEDVYMESVEIRTNEGTS
jgi:peptidyl-prolyl cis-trans isomerase B (cyclophilin B)